MTAMTPRGMPGCSEKPSHTVCGLGVCFFFARRRRVAGKQHAWQSSAPSLGSQDK